MAEPRRTLSSRHVEHLAWRAERKARHAPARDTREAILDIALDLFTRQGYDKTSLREIADALGFTKAALYYHFERKDDILFALHRRLHAVVPAMFGRLGSGDQVNDVESWRAAIDVFIDEVIANRELFLLHARNQSAFEKLEHDNPEHEADHEDMERALERLLENRSIPGPLRVRMACSLGAVLGGLMGSAATFSDMTTEELAANVRDAVHDLLAVSPPLRGGRPTAPKRRAAPARRRAARN